MTYGKGGVTLNVTCILVVYFRSLVAVALRCCLPAPLHSVRHSQPFTLLNHVPIVFTDSILSWRLMWNGRSRIDQLLIREQGQHIFLNHKTSDITMTHVHHTHQQWLPFDNGQSPKITGNLPNQMFSNSPCHSAFHVSLHRRLVGSVRGQTCRALQRGCSCYWRFRSPRPMRDEDISFPAWEDLLGTTTQVRTWAHSRGCVQVSLKCWIIIIIK